MSSSWLIKIADRWCSLACAVVLLQMPLFMSQYAERLGGHVEELHYQMDAVQKFASKSGYSLKGYIQQFFEDKSPVVSSQGEYLMQLQQRTQRLEKDAWRLQKATALSRPFVFLTTLDGQIAKNTFASFQPGVSFSIESALYALVGLVLGNCLFLVFSRSLRGLFKRKPAV